MKAFTTQASLSVNMYIQICDINNKIINLACSKMISDSGLLVILNQISSPVQIQYLPFLHQLYFSKVPEQIHHHLAAHQKVALLLQKEQTSFLTYQKVE